MHQIKGFKESTEYPGLFANKDGDLIRVSPVEISPSRRKDQPSQIRFHTHYKGNAIALWRVVCSAFHGPSPYPGCHVRHLDGDQMNNAASNLAWDYNRKENARDRQRHGNGLRGTTPQDVRSIRKSKKTAKELAEKYGLSVRSIYAIKNRESWKWLED